MNSFIEDSNDVVVDSEASNIPFVKCPTLLLLGYQKVVPRAKILYLVLKALVYQRHSRHVNPDDKEIVWPGRRRLALEMGCSLKTITNLLTNLRENGLIVSEKRGVGQAWCHRLLL